jgi:chromosome segregation ATPase
MSPPTKRKFPFDYDDDFGQLEPVVDGELTNPGAAAVNCLESSVEIVKTKIVKIEKAMYALDNMEGHLVRDKDVALAKLSKECEVVAAKEKKVVDAEKEKAALMEQLASKETKIKELNETLAKKDAEIEQLKKEKLAISVKTINGMEKLLVNLRDRLANKPNGNA